MERVLDSAERVTGAVRKGLLYLSSITVQIPVDADLTTTFLPPSSPHLYSASASSILTQTPPFA